MIKKILLGAAISFTISTNLLAQNNKPTQTTPAATPQTTNPAAAPIVYDFNKFWKLDKEIHDFGNLPLGPKATTVFVIKNTSKETIIIEKVQASCGCTAPDWTKEPIKPGKKGKITAVYNTEGRPGTFTKSLTIYTNRGTKSVTIMGNVNSNLATSPK
jgi:hypothetical protein